MIESGDVTILKLNVESLDALTVPELRSAVEHLVERGGVKVVVDMSAVRLIDSSGVGVIVGLFKRMRSLGGAVRVAGMSKQPSEIFRVMMLDRVLAIFPSAADALHGFVSGDHGP